MKGRGQEGRETRKDRGNVWEEKKKRKRKKILTLMVKITFLEDGTGLLVESTANAGREKDYEKKRKKESDKKKERRRDRERECV